MKTISGPSVTVFLAFVLISGSHESAAYNLRVIFSLI